MYSGGVYLLALILLCFNHSQKGTPVSPHNFLPPQLLAVTMARPILDSSHKQNCPVHGLLCLAACTTHAQCFQGSSTW